MWISEAYNTIKENAAAGIGIAASEVHEIRGNRIEYNKGPGITVIDGSFVGLIADTSLDYNGIASRATGMAVLDGSSASLRNTTISHSGTTGISIFHPGTSVVLENCQISNNGQCGYGPNLTVQSGASVVTRNCLFDVPAEGSPNIMVSGSGTTFTQSADKVSGSTKPGLVGSAGAAITIYDTLVDGKSLAGEMKNETRGLQLDNCQIDLQRVTVCNSAHHALAASYCAGIIKGCEFYQNAFAGGGHIVISSSTLDLIGNVLHHPAWFHNQIRIAYGSSCKVYHNTIVGQSCGKAGPVNQGPGDGVCVDATSTADIRNNIFLALPRGIGKENGATITALKNCSYQITGFDKGIGGDEPVLKDPKLTIAYTLMTGSPCLDIAALIPGVNGNYTGKGPDIGAREVAVQNSSSLSSCGAKSVPTSSGTTGPNVSSNASSNAAKAYVSPSTSTTDYALAFMDFNGLGGIESNKSLNYRPYFLPLNDQVVKAGQQLRFQVKAIDEERDPLKYSISDNPQGSIFNPSTRNFTWTPATNDLGQYYITFTVKDNHGGTDILNIMVDVR